MIWQYAYQKRFNSPYIDESLFTSDRILVHTELLHERFRCRLSINVLFGFCWIRFYQRLYMWI